MVAQFLLIPGYFQSFFSALSKDFTAGYSIRSLIQPAVVKNYQDQNNNQCVRTDPQNIIVEAGHCADDKRHKNCEEHYPEKFQDVFYRIFIRDTPRQKRLPDSLGRLFLPLGCHIESFLSPFTPYSPLKILSTRLPTLRRIS